jgi:8-oxo-dGTP pyrophosphatase MutT (NUDIX family)
MSKICKNRMICTNCNKHGHIQKTCRFPINSYGIFFFKKCTDGNNRYLMIQRKYSSPYIELIRSKYIKNSKFDIFYLILIIQSLPLTDRQYILKHTFDYLWNKLWQWGDGLPKNESINNEYNYCKFNFNKLKYGCIHINGCENIDFTTLFKMYPYTQIEPNWEFPKGRKVLGESDLQCAIREVKEETTLMQDDYIIHDESLYFTETFRGINGVLYKNKYFIAEFINKNKPLYYSPYNLEQNREIRKIGWFTDQEVVKLIGQHHPSKLKMFQKITNHINRVHM